MAEEKFTFQAEVSKLLKIVANSLYSNKEIFLRELVSNASDACDKLRYESLTKPALIKGDTDFKIRITANKKQKALTVEDNGIGMNKQDLLEMLGTIARSGTQAFMDNLGQTGDTGKKASSKAKNKKQQDMVQLIGQFGVGFYSTFMVADKVEVLTRKAGEQKAWLWVSDGESDFTISESERAQRGTTITVYLSKDNKEYLDKPRIQHIVTTYSDHISIPIYFSDEQKKETEADEEKLNTASSLWSRPKKEITDEQYKEFYHHVAHAFDDPWMVIHNVVEGVTSYTNLLFIPGMKPFDLFDAERKSHLKLYANKIFITDDCEHLMPSYLRFVKGIVDSPDISLNISRELLQKNAVLATLKKRLTNRILTELGKKADKAPEDYAAFWNNFGIVLKEGLYEDRENQEKLLTLSRFHSTGSDDLTSFDIYLENMKEGQEHIYYISGEDRDSVANSPHLEGFRTKGINVLFFTDPIDEFWVGSVDEVKGKKLKSVTQGLTDLESIGAPEDKAKEETKEEKKPDGFEALLAAIKVTLGESIKDVRPSQRLTDSPVCLVSDEGDMGLQMERMLKAHNRLPTGHVSPRILEVNPHHALIKSLSTIAKKDAKEKSIEDAAHLLFDQARILEGSPVLNPAGFAKRLSAVIARGL